MKYQCVLSTKKYSQEKNNDSRSQIKVSFFNNVLEWVCLVFYDILCSLWINMNKRTYNIGNRQSLKIKMNTWINRKQQTSWSIQIKGFLKHEYINLDTHKSYKSLLLFLLHLVYLEKYLIVLFFFGSRFAFLLI